MQRQTGGAPSSSSPSTRSTLAAATCKVQSLITSSDRLRLLRETGEEDVSRGVTQNGSGRPVGPHSSSDAKSEIACNAEVVPSRDEGWYASAPIVTVVTEETMAKAREVPTVPPSGTFTGASASSTTYQKSINNPNEHTDTTTREPKIYTGTDSDLNGNGERNYGAVCSVGVAPPAEDSGKEWYGVEPARYVVLLGLCLINACNMLLWITYSAIVTPSEARYGFNAADINALNITYMAVYSAAFWISGVLLPRTGLGWGLVLSGLFNVAVTVMRLITTWVPEENFSSFPHYEVILMGNLIGGLCQVVVLCAPPMCSNQWFALSERNFATGMGAGAQVMGGALGALLPALIVTEGTNQEFATLYWVQFAIAAAGLLVALVAKKKPTLPPSPGASKMAEGSNRTTKAVGEEAKRDVHVGGEGSSESVSLSQAIIQKLRSALTTVLALLRIPSFVLIIVISGLIQGTFWTAASLMMQIAEPFGVSQEAIGWFGFAGQIVGGVGAVAVSGVLAVFSDYKPVLLALSALAFACGLAYPAVTQSVGLDEEEGISTGLSTVLAGVLYVGMSICCITQVPILFELGIEESFPISEEVTSPFVMWTPSLISVILVQCLGALLTNNPSREEALWALYVMAAMMLVAVLASLSLRLTYKRRVYEKEHGSSSNEFVGAGAGGPDPIAPEEERKHSSVREERLGGCVRGFGTTPDVFVSSSSALLTRGETKK